MSKVTTRQTYDKGAWVLHMLKNEIGDENWWLGIRNYYRKYMDSHATTDDFRFEMETVCSCNLSPFFDQWLYQGGNVVLDGEWRYDELTNTVEINLSQAQNDGFGFSVDVEIGVYTSGDPLPSIHKLPLTGTSGRLSIPFVEIPERVVVDPRTVLLAQWTFTEKAK